MTDIAQDNIPRPSLLKDFLNAFGRIFIRQNKEIITVLRTPTPVKFTKTVHVDDHGCIGSGLDTPNPVEVYRNSESSEGWLHIITITSPQYGPSSPLQVGQLLMTGTTAGQVIFWLPQAGDLAPVQMREGRLSASHLNPGEVVQVVGDQLPPGISLRFDFQVVLVTGMSEFTPRSNAPSDLTPSNILD